MDWNWCQQNYSLSKRKLSTPLLKLLEGWLCWGILSQTSICANSLYKVCQTNYCPLSHDITDEHNSNIFKRYNLGFLLKWAKTHVLPNILVSNRSGNPANVLKSAYTDLSKSCQSVSRASLSKSFESISETGTTSLKGRLFSITKMSNI